MSYFSEIHQWELPLIQAVQSIRTQALDQCFLFLRMFDSFPIYLIILATTWHLKDRKKGFHLTCLQNLGVLLYVTLKYFFAEPRPYDLMPTLKILPSSTYGFPSAAALTSMITFGFIGFFLGSTKFLLKMTAIFLILLVGFMRVYLGAHFPSDVVGGWLIGFIILLSYRCLITHIEEKSTLLSKNLFLFIALLCVISFLWIHLSIHLIIMTMFFLGTLIGYIFLKPNTQKSSFLSTVIAVVGICFLYKMLHIMDKKIIFIIPISFLMGLWISISEQIMSYLKKSTLTLKKDHSGH